MNEFAGLSDDELRAAAQRLLAALRKGGQKSMIEELLKRWLNVTLKDSVFNRAGDNIDLVMKPTLWPVSIEWEKKHTGVLFLGYAANSEEAYKFARFGEANAWMFKRWGKAEALRRIRKMWVNEKRIMEIEKTLDKGKKKAHSGFGHVSPERKES
jgi:hypothetical protein